jgi:hypothetical protein
MAHTAVLRQAGIVLRLTLFAIFELLFFVSSLVHKIPPERKAAKCYLQAY